MPTERDFMNITTSINCARQWSPRKAEPLSLLLAHFRFHHLCNSGAPLPPPPPPLLFIVLLVNSAKSKKSEICLHSKKRYTSGDGSVVYKIDLGDITIYKHCFCHSNFYLFRFTKQCDPGCDININRWRQREYRFNPWLVCETHFSLFGNMWLLTIDMGCSDHHRHDTSVTTIVTVTSFVTVTTLVTTPTIQFITITWEAKRVRLMIHDSVLDSLL